MKRKNVAIILAGGVGARSGLTVPKQFFKFAGKTVLEHTVDAFQKSQNIDEIAIVAAPQYHGEIVKLCGEAGKLKKILINGKERYHSTLSAIKAYENEEGINLIIHDAVRPLVSARIIQDCVEALKHSPAVATAIPSSDTIIEAEGGAVVNVPPRSRFWRGQTPQCFYLEILKKAYEKALTNPKFEATDDCKIVSTYCPEVNILVVQGDEGNVKLTYAEDIYLIDRLFQLRRESFDSTSAPSLTLLKGKTIAVFGGSAVVGEAIASEAAAFGAEVHTFSRSTGTDITKPDEVCRALGGIGKPIDGVFFTAGEPKRAPLASMGYEDIRAVLDANIMGSIVCAKEAYTYLKVSKGMILFFSSSSCTGGRQFYGPYSASKAAIINLTQTLAEEWQGDGIRVNCISPERTSTPIRTQALGIEAPDTLSESKTLAKASLQALLEDFSGQIINIKTEGNEPH